MDRVIAGENGLLSSIGVVAILLVVAFAMITVVYGLDTIASGVHDVFHDFRHTIGFPCH
ncbi:MAG: CbtB-domain containing protein [Proteobacteria bacterium]|nr:CbtB-domain containing protein [Pseudomonadota bacterium]